jgi:hypothetical protein
MGKPHGQTEAFEASKQATRESQERAAMQKQIFRQIQPFATMLMGLGIDPAQFMQSPLGQGLLSQMRGGISDSFQGARQNLIENLGATGFQGSGVGFGPLANLFGQEAQAQSQLFQQLPQIGLNLGLQGANILQGQQGVFDPLGFAQTGIQGFNQLQQGQLLKNILGAAGMALGGPLGGALGSNLLGGASAGTGSTIGGLSSGLPIAG